MIAPCFDASLAATLHALKRIFCSVECRPPIGVHMQDSQYGSSYSVWIVHFRDHIAMQFSKSNKLANVCYDIRGPVLKHPNDWKRKASASSS